MWFLQCCRYLQPKLHSYTCIYSGCSILLLYNLRFRILYHHKFVTAKRQQKTQKAAWIDWQITVWFQTKWNYLLLTMQKNVPKNNCVLLQASNHESLWRKRVEAINKKPWKIENRLIFSRYSGLKSQNNMIKFHHTEYSFS